MKSIIEVDGFLLFKCPTCQCFLTVNQKETNCKILRHGVYKENMRQIDPHASKEVCDDLVKKNLIYGCGKPIKIEKNTFGYYAVVCDYNS